MSWCFESRFFVCIVACQSTSRCLQLDIQEWINPRRYRDHLLAVFLLFFDSTCPAIAQKEMYTKHFRARPDDQCAEMNIFLRNKCNKFSTLFLSHQKQYDDGLHGYMDASAAAMYDPHSGHRPGLPGLPPHHSPHMNHAAAAGMHGYHGTPSHVSQATNHMGAVQPDKRDKEAIYG
jgi:hypothetical protein